MTLGASPEALDQTISVPISLQPLCLPSSHEREPRGRPFRQAQGPEPVEGLGALSLSNGRVEALPLAHARGYNRTRPQPVSAERTPSG